MTRQRTSNKCLNCGGWMYPDFDGLTCLICGRQTVPKGYKAIGEISFGEPSSVPQIRSKRQSVTEMYPPTIWTGNIGEH